MNGEVIAKFIAGIVMVLGSLGIVIDPGVVEQFTTLVIGVVMGVVGLLEMVRAYLKNKRINDAAAGS